MRPPGGPNMLTQGTVICLPTWSVLVDIKWQDVTLVSAGSRANKIDSTLILDAGTGTSLFACDRVV